MHAESSIMRLMVCVLKMLSVQLVIGSKDADLQSALNDTSTKTTTT